MAMSLFQQVYQGAKDNVSNIIIANEKDSPGNVEKFINTNIAFVGDRGAGKSSAMASFASWLGKEGRTQLFCEKRCDFYSIPVIDANQLGKNETIIGRISAALMIEYDDGKAKLSTEERREFIKTASRVNDLAVKYCLGTWFKSNDSLVDDTVSISRMREEVEKLIKQFLRIKQKDPERSYLVVSIDDIDMGIDNSYSIMEEIRKFLCVSNVIVLVSLDVKQLEMILKANYIKALGRNNLEEPDMAIVKNLSYRYIEKLFPYGRQHRMPELTLNRLKNISSENFMNDEDKNWSCILDSGAPNVFEATLHMIWRKTMLIPVCNADGDHLLVPRNLRSLYNMVVFLRNLPDAVVFSDETNQEEVVSQQNYTIIRSNLDAFKCYILDNIETFEIREMSNTDQEMARILLNVISEFPDMTLRTMNSKIVADILYSIKTKEDGNIYKDIFFEKGEYSADNILKASVYPDSISMGDMMYVIGKIDAKTKCRYINYLIEIIRILWSIEMTKEYYSCLDAPGNRKAYDYNEVSPEFLRAVGGLVINPDKARFCYIKESDDVDKRWFVYDEVQSDVPDSVNLFEKVSDKSGDEKDIMRYVASSMVVCKKNDDDENAWRINRKLAKPYYEFAPTTNDSEFDSSIYIHPYAIFTHILHGGKMNNLSKPINKYHSLADEVCEMLRNNGLHNMPIPLYSMDFMYRWYEVMKQFMKSTEEDSYINCFRKMFDFGAVSNQSTDNTGEGFFDNIKRYIPSGFAEKVIEQPLKLIHDSISELIKSTGKPADGNIVSSIKRDYLDKEYNDESGWRNDRDLVSNLLKETRYTSRIGELNSTNNAEEFKKVLKKILSDLSPALFSAGEPQ